MGRLPVGLRVLIELSILCLVVVIPFSLLDLWEAGNWTPLPVILTISFLDLMRVDLFAREKDGRTFFTLITLGLFFVLAMFGTAWAVAATLFHTVITMVRMRTALHRAIFNIGIGTTSIFVAGWLLDAVGTTPHEWVYVAVVLTAVSLQVLINATSVGLAVSFSTGRSLLPMVRESFGWISLQQWVLAVTGFALGRVVMEIGWIAVLLASPVFLLRISYLSYVKSQSEHTEELKRFANQLITTLASVVDARDAYTFGHSTQVARYSVAIGERLGLTGERLDRLRVGALLHDIGKVGIPEAILFKPARLEPWEYELMKEHTTIGHRIVSQIERLQFAADVIYQHHEWMNGKGYPRGLAGAKVLQEARIVGVADALESLMSDRPYRKGCTLGEAMAELRRCSGEQFDPEVIAALEQVIAAEGSGFFVNSATIVDEAHAGVVAAAGWRRAQAVSAASSSP